MYYIYKHTTPDGKCYIGQTTNPKRRWKKGAYASCPKFYQAIETFVWKSIAHEILCTCEDADEATEKEAYYINFYDSVNNGYNTVIGAGKYLCGENNPMYGISVKSLMTEEEILAWRRKLSIAQTGDRNGFYGKHHSTESIEKIRSKKIGVSHKLNLSDEQRQAISDRGKRMWTAERRSEQSAKMSGKNNPMYGRVASEEERQAMRERFLGERSIRAKKLLIIDTIEGTETICNCMKYATQIIGINNSHIRRYLDKDKLYKGRYLLKGVS